MSPRAWELRLQGLRNQALIDRLEAEGHGRLSTSGLYKMLARVEKRVAANMTMESVRQTAEQLVRLDLIVAESMQAWEQSKQDGRAIREKRTPGQDQGTERVETTREQKGQCGDPAFLRTAMEAMAEQRKILGLNAPRQWDVTSGGKPIPTFEQVKIIEVVRPEPEGS